MPPAANPGQAAGGCRHHRDRLQHRHDRQGDRPRRRLLAIYHRDLARRYGESDEDSDQSEEERDRDGDAAEGLQLSEVAVVRLMA